jgi:hypothetical protein
LRRELKRQLRSFAREVKRQLTGFAREVKRQLTGCGREAAHQIGSGWGEEPVHRSLAEVGSPGSCSAIQGTVAARVEPLDRGALSAVGAIWRTTPWMVSGYLTEVCNEDDYG